MYFNLLGVTLIIYVDDIILTGNNVKGIEQ
jgi:predicted amidophosphoribosyltransferase